MTSLARASGGPDRAGARRLASLAALLPVLALYVSTGALSPGLDDETYTIGWVRQAGTLRELVSFVAGSDLHPPGSYIIVSLLHDLTGSFPAVRAIAGALNAVMLWWLWRETAPRAPLAAFFAWTVLCLSPTLLLWGATLRWFSWFVPLVAALLILIRRDPPGSWRFWGGFAALAILLVHVGYFALVALPAFLAAALWRRRDRLRREGPVIVATAAVTLAAIAPLIVLVLLPRQIDHAVMQHGQSVIQRVLGVGYHLFSTHAAMPPSLPAVAFVLGNLILLGAAVRAGRSAFATPAAIVFLGGLTAAFAAGLTGHFRSLVALSPAQGVWQGELFAALRAPVWRGAALALLLAGTGVGIVNVVTHRDTTKGGWNTPYGEVLETIAGFRERCPAAPVATHDPVLFWHLKRGAAGEEVTPLWPDARTPPSHPPGTAAPFGTVPETIREAPCLITVETFRGSMSPDLHRRYQAAIDARPGAREVRRIGPDRHAGLKRMFDPAAPDHAAVVTFFPPE